MADALAASDSDGPIINDNVIRIQLRKPQHRKWELRTRNRSPGLAFPTIQLFDCEGNILVETNDDNVSIKSSDYHEPDLKTSQSLNEKDYRHVIKNGLKKSHTVAGNKIYTRLFKNISPNNGDCDNVTGTKISNNKTLRVVIPSRQSSLDSILPSSDVFSDRENSSYKSSDNESSAWEAQHSYITSKAGTLLISPDKKINSPFRRHRPKTVTESENYEFIDNTNNKSYEQICSQSSMDKDDGPQQRVYKSKSFNATTCHPLRERTTRRSKTEVFSSRPEYSAPANKVSFLDTYLRSLPSRTKSNPEWCSSSYSRPDVPRKSDSVKFRDSVNLQTERQRRYCHMWEDKSDSDVLNVSSDVAAAEELRRRLREYRRGASEMELAKPEDGCARVRRKSEGDCESETSSSESPDEADAVLNRLRRRILKNKSRERRTIDGHQHRSSQKRANRSPLVEQSSVASSIPDEPAPHGSGARLEACCRRAPADMGSNISHHSVKGLTGRRARSSGDLCNGEKSPETAVYGSVVGDVLAWNRSLPNHLDGNRHLANDYGGTVPRGNNNYGEGSFHPKGVRAWRYRASKSGSEAEPVWKLQDPGCDQGYGSERSPEEDYPPASRPVTYEEYEAQLRLMYPFITEENTFTVVVEKDGRGLGMSVSGGDGADGGGGGLVRIRRLYPPQPAWRTGRLAPRDLLLAANGVPLAGLSTYEALEVLRTTAACVELRVCRPPADVLDCLTPPAPPTPPARHTPMPPPDPLNCHPLHTRLSATTSSATTSSSEGRYGSAMGGGGAGTRRDVPSPEPQYARPGSLTLPDLERPLPVYDVQYGEFDIIMTKVNGSLGFTLRKEDHSALGHYVRALVREPALSDGRIQPGDRIVAVNEVSMSGMSHADAVTFLRACGAEVRLRLYRDHAATPLSPLSPQESQERHSPSDSDTATVRPRPHLRQEAVNMLSDLAARRLTPDAPPDGSRSPCLSPRKYRKLTRDCTGLSQGSVAPHGYELNNLDNDVLDAPNIYQDGSRAHRPAHPHYLSAGHFHTDVSTEPMSMPVDMSSGEDAHFTHKNPAYQSAVVHPSSDNTSGNESHKDDGNGLKKWKGKTLSPENERRAKPELKPKCNEPIQKENVKPEEGAEISSEPTILTVELNRGWNSRLGFSVQSHPESGQSYVSAIYSDSVAARDGRLRKGDVILQVNDENVTSMKTPEVIDLMRILRGSICITVLRPNLQ